MAPTGNLMPDRSRWVTPRGQQPTTLTAEYLDQCPVGTVLSVPSGLPRAGSPADVSLSVEKVSSRKWCIHSRRGFDARHLVGLPARQRQRRSEVEPGQ